MLPFESDHLGRTFGRAPRECQSCHNDPHAGQFRQDGQTDCSRCHSDTTSFNNTDFDHQQDSRFKLDEHHITLDCVACHKPIVLGEGVEVVRYRPLGTRCEDCHDSRDHKFRDRGDDDGDDDRGRHRRRRRRRGRKGDEDR